MSLPRSLPAGISSSSPTPPTTAEDTSTMASSDNKSGGLMNFTKTIVLPILIALLLYLLLFHALLPLYRRHRARYAQYLPLNSLPQSLQPSSLRSRLSSLFLRVFLPSTYAFQQLRSTRAGVNRRPSIPSTISEEDSFDHASDRFSDDHGEAMVGFDINSQGTRNSNNTIQDQNRRRRDGMERQVARGILAAREMNAAAFDEPPPERRLSRELEEVFRDDSESDDEDETHGVTVGRRSLSVSRR